MFQWVQREVWWMSLGVTCVSLKTTSLKVGKLASTSITNPVTTWSKYHIRKQMFCQVGLWLNYIQLFQTTCIVTCCSKSTFEYVHFVLVYCTVLYCTVLYCTISGGTAHLCFGNIVLVISMSIRPIGIDFFETAVQWKPSTKEVYILVLFVLLPYLAVLDGSHACACHYNIPGACNTQIRELPILLNFWPQVMLHFGLFRHQAKTNPWNKTVVFWCCCIYFELKFFKNFSYSNSVVEVAFGHCYQKERIITYQKCSYIISKYDWLMTQTINWLQ